MGATYTTGDGVTVGARESLTRTGGAVVFDGRPVAEVTFPNGALDPVNVYKPYGSYDEAKAAAKALAGEVNRIAPKGFPRLRGSYRDADKAARAAVETLVREWAGPEALIDEIEG
jgi:hypothetical protein